MQVCLGSSPSADEKRESRVGGAMQVCFGPGPSSRREWANRTRGEGEDRRAGVEDRLARKSEPRAKRRVASPPAQGGPQRKSAESAPKGSDTAAQLGRTSRQAVRGSTGRTRPEPGSAGSVLPEKKNTGQEGPAARKRGEEGKPAKQVPRRPGPGTRLGARECRDRVTANRPRRARDTRPVAGSGSTRALTGRATAEGWPEAAGMGRGWPRPT